MKDKRKFIELIKEAENILEENGVADYKNDARLLCEYVFNIDRNYLYLHGNENADSILIEKYFGLVQKRAGHIPLQHITGTAWFMDWEFKVNENVLIPRQDTEILVEEAFDIIKELASEKKNNETIKVLDLCTGSGCIAISLYKMVERENLASDITFQAFDISDDALKVAKENAKLNKANISFEKRDLLEGVELDYDLIVSNPPYIERDVIEDLMPEVKDYEPRLALDGGIDGLDFYKRIIKAVNESIKKMWIAFEIGCNQAKSLETLFEENGYKKIKTVKDLAGLDRVALARKL